MLPTLVSDLDVELRGCQAGTLEVWFHYRGERLKVFTSVPIDFPKNGEGVVYVSWGGTGVNVSLGPDDIPAYSATDVVHYLQLTPQFPGTGERSFNDPDAAYRCTPWTDWRRTHLSGNEVPAGRITKTLPEQLADLSDAANRIRDLLGLLEAGQTHWAGVLAVELRALVHWREKDFLTSKGSNKHKSIPLLFRVAQYRDLPLPVYMFAPQQRPTSDVTQIRSDTFTLAHISGHQRVGDVQQWLSHPALFDPVEGTWGMKDLIASYAETKGPGHYDTGVPSVFDLLSRGGAGNATTTVEYLSKVGRGVHTLTEHVLDHFADAS